MEIREGWRRLLLEWEAAKHYHFPYALLIGHTFRNPLIERILPSLLLVKAAAILDEALEDFIAAHFHGLPRKYRATLEGRINFLSDRGQLPSDDQLHEIRKRRNAVAHEKDATIDWPGLETALLEIERALLLLKLIGPRPKLEYFGERSALEAGSEPGVDHVRTYTIGVRENGQPAYEASWLESIYSAAL